jgi:sulfatase maturation enzyme AslB (radical SAM superfamily)
MSEAIADKGIDFTFRSPTRSIKIEFQGGEPLLNFPLIKYIVLKAKERNLVERRNLEFVITTNLSPITDEILAFCREHDIYISSSLDGPEDLHNANRPKDGNNSYHLTIEGIKRVRETLGVDYISVLMTTTRASLPRVTEIIDEYVKQGFRGIFLRTLSPYGFALKTKLF